MNYRYKSLSLPLPFCVLAFVMLAGCSSARAPSASVAEVGVVTMKTERLPITTELSGRTSGYLAADVRPQVGGVIQKRLFTEGDDVKAGAMLYQIDPATYQAALATAKATLASAQAAMVSARSKASRDAELVKIDAISKQDNDDAVAALNEAQAQVASGKAAVQAAQINLDFTSITAPIAGRIGTSTVTPGALVTAGQADALTSITRLDPIYIDVTQSSADLLRLRSELASGKLKRGHGADVARVTLLLEDGSTYDHEGDLQVRGVTVDPTSGSVTLRAVVANPDQLLLPGMYVRARLEEAVAEQAILAPQQAVTRNTDGSAHVLVVGAQNKVIQRSVTLDRAVGTRWLVTSGLAAGDRVIVDGGQKVNVGDTVKPVANTTEPAVASSSTGAPVVAASSASAPATAASAY